MEQHWSYSLASAIQEVKAIHICLIVRKWATCNLPFSKPICAFQPITMSDLCSSFSSFLLNLLLPAPLTLPCLSITAHSVSQGHALINTSGLMSFSISWYTCAHTPAHTHTHPHTATHAHFVIPYAQCCKCWLGGKFIDFTTQSD